MPLDRMQEEIKEIASRAFNGLIRSFDFLIDLLTTTADGVSLDYQVLIEARIKNLTSSPSKKLSSDDSSSEESTQTKDQVEQLERLKSIITSQT